MTSVSIKQNGSDISFIEVKGHSGYACQGSDIVCSAVSTAVYVSIGLLEKANAKFELKEDEKSALISIQILEVNDLTNLIMSNLKDALESIALEYKQYVKIK